MTLQIKLFRFQSDRFPVFFYTAGKLAFQGLPLSVRQVSHSAELLGSLGGKLVRPPLSFTFVLVAGELSRTLNIFL